MLFVNSSMMNISVFRRSALPMDMSCFSPKETLSPLAVILVSNPFRLKDGLSKIPNLWITDNKSKSEQVPIGSRFSFKLPS